MKAPLPYFGGKSRVARRIWARLGDTPNYCEAFAGSLAVLLARPDAHEWWERTETVNDIDGLLCNLWRAMSRDPDAVAQAADWPVSECDLHARNLWLVGEKARIVEALVGDPDWYDAKAAGWWLWGICSWVGSKWCSGKGPWISVDGRLVDSREQGGGNAGMGINRRLPHLGNAGMGINRQIPHLDGRGINRQIPHLNGRGHADAWSEHLRTMMRDLRDRLRRVRICCGEWDRILGPSPTTRQGLTGVFLDPPYGALDRDTAIYTHDSLDVAGAVRIWALEHGDDPQMRICLAGYEGEHEMPATWACVAWKAKGGYASQGRTANQNRHRERLWFSPHCLRPEAHPRQLTMDFALEVRARATFTIRE